MNTETNYYISMNVLCNYDNAEVIIKGTIFLLLNALDIWIMKLILQRWIEKQLKDELGLNILG